MIFNTMVIYYMFLLDFILYQVITGRLKCEENFNLMDGRLLICGIAVGVAGFALLWDGIYPFPMSRYIYFEQIWIVAIFIWIRSPLLHAVAVAAIALLWDYIFLFSMSKYICFEWLELQMFELRDPFIICSFCSGICFTLGLYLYFLCQCIFFLTNFIGTDNFAWIKSHSFIPGIHLNLNYFY